MGRTAVGAKTIWGIVFAIGHQLSLICFLREAKSKCYDNLTEANKKIL